MAEKKTTRQRIKDYLVITFASAVYAVAVSLFLDPNSLAPGGVTGIAIILNRLTGLETGTWVLFINIPIIALGTWKLGWRFILSTGYCTLISSLFINLLSPFGASDRGCFWRQWREAVLWRWDLDWFSSQVRPPEERILL